jgi:hypothetical protein
MSRPSIARGQTGCPVAELGHLASAALAAAGDGNVRLPSKTTSFTPRRRCEVQPHQAQQLSSGSAVKSSSRRPPQLARGVLRSMSASIFSSTVPRQDEFVTSTLRRCRCERRDRRLALDGRGSQRSRKWTDERGRRQVQAGAPHQGSTKKGTARPLEALTTLALRTARPACRTRPGGRKSPREAGRGAVTRGMGEHQHLLAWRRSPPELAERDTSAVLRVLAARPSHCEGWFAVCLKRIKNARRGPRSPYALRARAPGGARVRPAGRGTLAAGEETVRFTRSSPGDPRYGPVGLKRRKSRAATSSAAAVGAGDRRGALVVGRERSRGAEQPRVEEVDEDQRSPGGSRWGGGAVRRPRLGAEFLTAGSAGARVLDGWASSEDREAPVGRCEPGHAQERADCDDEITPRAAMRWDRRSHAAGMGRVGGLAGEGRGRSARLGAQLARASRGTEQARRARSGASGQDEQERETWIVLPRPCVGRHAPRRGSREVEQPGPPAAGRAELAA